jgi:hypothetical protein
MSKCVKCRSKIQPFEYRYTINSEDYHVKCGYCDVCNKKLCKPFKENNNEKILCDESCEPKIRRSYIVPNVILKQLHESQNFLLYKKYLGANGPWPWSFVEKEENQNE